MQFDTNNKIVKLCIHGMDLEGEGKNDEAAKIFLQAWDQAGDDNEKFTAAHYVARHQQSIADKLAWDNVALNLALKIKDDSIKGAYSSLYLNIAKGYEDLNDFAMAKESYELALKFTAFLLDDGYGNMIKKGINQGLERVLLNHYPIQK